MKPGINQWAFPGDMSAIECITIAKRIGFMAFEVCIGDKGPTRMDASEADIRAIRKHADSLGVALHSVASGMGWQYPLSSLDLTARQKAKEVIARGLEIASWLGADSLLVVPGVVDNRTPYDAALENALSGIRELVPIAERFKVSIAVENVWNKFLLSPVEMRDFVDQCESEYVGAYVDVGNMIPYGYPEQWIKILGKRVRAIHMKDFRSSVGTLGGFVMLMEGDVNWPAVMAALREIGYDKSLTAEYGPYTYSREAMLSHVLTSLQTIMRL